MCKKPINIVTNGRSTLKELPTALPLQASVQVPLLESGYHWRGSAIHTNHSHSQIASTATGSRESVFQSIALTENVTPFPGFWKNVLLAYWVRGNFGRCGCMSKGQDRSSNFILTRWYKTTV